MGLCLQGASFSQFEVLDVAWVENLGGDNLEVVLMEHFADQFNQGLGGGADVRASPKAMAKLRNQVGLHIAANRAACQHAGCSGGGAGSHCRRMVWRDGRCMQGCLVRHGCRDGLHCRHRGGFRARIHTLHILSLCIAVFPPCTALLVNVGVYVQVKRTKQILSANTEAPISVEELYQDRDFRSSITRTQFEELAGRSP